MSLNLRRLGVAVVFVTLLSLACGRGEDKVEEALESVTDDQLSIMVLPQEAHGDIAAGLEVDPDSGVQGGEDVADDTFDPDDDAADLKSAGFVTGYSLNFHDPSLSALEEGEGIIDASSTVELFEDEAGASAHLTRLLEQSREFEGEELEAGTTLEEVEEFTVAGIADDATGLVLHGSFGDTDFYATGVIFTVGRLRAGAGITLADDGDVKKDAETIGRALAERIEAVLLGKIDATPVPIPEEGEEPEGSQPRDPPFPHRMALNLDDLPDGVSIEREAYIADEDAVASYEREFDMGDAQLGSTVLNFVESDVTLHEDSTDARLYFIGASIATTGEEGEQIFIDEISRNLDFTASDIDIQSLDFPAQGDQSAAFLSSIGTPFGTLDQVYFVVRVGRATGLLIAQGFQGEVTPSDLIPLAQAMTDRIESELAENP